MKSIIILGSAALKIGQAGEFDYSGSQAIKALKEEGVRVILINPNIATTQTDEGLADSIYLLPVEPYFVEQVIKKEQPDGILLSFGGQTALNCGIKMQEQGILERYNLQVLGTPVEAIKITEDRQLFVDALNQIQIKTAVSQAVNSVDQAVKAAEVVGYPLIIRSAFSLGGLGSAICDDQKTLEKVAKLALGQSTQILIEESLAGWKEVEYEIVRDAQNNCIAVCNMENLDPLGVHTGESIVVAPSQTLNNQEYHFLREIALKTVRHLGIVGECNIQYALSTQTNDYRVIEVNARLSRSSALASKATGYPLAFVAAKLGLGYSLVDLKNAVTQATIACFEPALDYVVVKVPRWDLDKFSGAIHQIGTSMKSVGEVMAIGRTFEEALQKALRMLDIGVDGLQGLELSKNAIQEQLKTPSTKRIFIVAAAFKAGFSTPEVHALTQIDPWFLEGLQQILNIEQQLEQTTSNALPKHLPKPLPKPLLKQAKQNGFADRQIARLCGMDEARIRAMRTEYNLHPCIKQIDTLAGEYPAQTNYLYLSYNGEQDDVSFKNPQAIKPKAIKPKVIVLGSGVYRIGSSVEFDWCCVNTVRAAARLGFETIILNFNPETVSTDYDETDRLYFDEISLETLIEIYTKEQPIGIILAMGGQVANNLALPIHQCGMRILGTQAELIDHAEDRHKFSSMLDHLNIEQPAWVEALTQQEAIDFSNQVGYPILIRPSYVLSGSAMRVAADEQSLLQFWQHALKISKEHPVVLSKFIEDAREIEWDAVASEGEVLAAAICEHVENAGVHSGDATLVLPPQRLYLQTLNKVEMMAKKIVKQLQVTGPVNIQFLAKNQQVKVIECNLRASRSFPFVSKVCRQNLIQLATEAILKPYVPNLQLTKPEQQLLVPNGYVGVKAAQFSFVRILGADPALGVEMSSTGEVGCLGVDFEEALVKALLSVGFRFPLHRVLLSTGPLLKKIKFLQVAKLLEKNQVQIYATRGTHLHLKEHQIQSTLVHWPDEKHQPNALSLIEQQQLDLVINIPKALERKELSNDYNIRRAAVDFAIPLVTNAELAIRLIEAYDKKSLKDLHTQALANYVF